MSDDGSTRSWWTRMFGGPNTTDGGASDDTTKGLSMLDVGRLQETVRMLAHRLEEVEAEEQAQRRRSEELEREHARLLAELAAERDQRHKSETARAELEKTLRERDLQARMQAAELGKLRVTSRKAQDRANERDGELVQLRRAVEAVRTQLRDTELRASQEETARSKLTTELAKTRTYVSQLETRERDAGRRLAAMVVFARWAAFTGSEALRLCVGDRIALPLSTIWASTPPPHPSARAAALDTKTLSDHLSRLGLCSSVAAERVDQGVLVKGTAAEGFARADSATRWIVEYLRTWVTATSGREHRIRELDVSESAPSFSVFLE